MADDVRVLTFKDLRERKGWKVSAVHTRRLILGGRFPAPFKTSPSGLNYWLESDIDRYFSEKAKLARESGGNK